MSQAISIDWTTIKRLLSRKYPRRFIPFSSYKRAGFDLSQRLKWLAFASGVPRPLPEIDAKAVLATVTGNAIVRVKQLPRDVVIYGIHKKGMSLLTELQEHSPLFRNRKVIDDLMDTRAIVRGHDVLILDDSIHNGKTIAKHVERLIGEHAKSISVFTVVSSRSGLENAVLRQAEIMSVLDTKEEAFTLAFGLFMVPLLGLFRNGVLSNRPYRAHRIACKRANRTKVAYDVVAALVRASITKRIEEIPPADDAQTPVFHGTLILQSRVVEDLGRRLGPVGELDQAKMRLIVSAFRDHIHLCVCSIVWPQSKAGLSESAINIACDRQSARLLSQVSKELKTLLRKRGYEVKAGRTSDDSHRSSGSQPRRGHASLTRRRR